MDLEWAVMEAGFSVALIERALYDPTPWTMSWGGQVTSVKRVRRDRGVMLTGDFEPACYLGIPEPVVTIWSGDEVLMVRPLDAHPGDGGFTFEVYLGVAHADLSRAA